MRMKLLVIFIGFLCSFSIIPVIHADINQGRINYSYPEYESMVPSNSCNCVAFRMDDIQNLGFLYVQLEVLEIFRENNIR